MEKGEPSGSRASANDAVWAKLVPSNSPSSDIELTTNETVICSKVSISSSEKREWCKITRNEDLDSASLLNKSSAIILVDELAIEDENIAIIRCGSEIIAGPDRKGYLSYRFEVMPTEEPSSQQLKISLDAEHAKCSICLNIWHDVVTVAPCLHNFCNGCFSEWLRTCQEKHSNVRCPQCRAAVQFVARNHFLQNIEEEILLADSSLKRSKADVALLDSYASIRSPLVISGRKNSRRKRAHSPSNEESNLELPCPQCGTVLGGFQCNQSTLHLQCHACTGMMPSRMNTTVPQHCLGCDQAFCAAYWDAHHVTGTVTHPVCSRENFKPISERTIIRIPSLAHERNRQEQDMTEKCIRQMGRTLQDVILEWITKFTNREIDRTRLPLNHAEMITAQTHVCNECYEKFVSFLLYWFRITLPKHFLPPDASQRGDCWYGYVCRTQHHNEDHARRRNHVCRPTRGNHM